MPRSDGVDGAGEAAPSLVEETMDNVRKTLAAHVAGVKKDEFAAKYKEIIGEELEVKRIGFFNTNAFLRSLVGKVARFDVKTGSNEVNIVLREDFPGTDTNGSYRG